MRESASHGDHFAIATTGGDEDRRRQAASIQAPVMPSAPLPDVARARRHGLLDADPAVRYAFSGRRDGNMSLVVGPTERAVDARRRFLAASGLKLESAVFAGQVHGPAVATVTADDRGRGACRHHDAVPEVDALVTEADGVAVAVLVADCVPVLLAVPGGAVAAVHAGRRGVAAGIVPAAVEALHAGDPRSVVAVIGPAIGGCCYEVPRQLMRDVAARVPEAEARTTLGTFALDLPAAVTAQLRAASVADIRLVGGCTRCGAEGWFSHRAHADGPRAGRQLALIWKDAGGDG